MTHRLILVLLLFVYQVSSENVENSTARVENSTGNAAVTARKADNNLVYAELVTCALRYDTACLVGVAEDYLDIRKQELLAQADAQVARSLGRADSENTPSQLANTIEKLITDLSGLFKNGISSLFSAREGDDDDVVDDEENKDDEEEDEKNQKNDSKDVGENSRGTRKEKKPHKLVRLVRKIMVFVVIVTMLNFLLKFYYALLAKKYLLISSGYFLIHLVKSWFWLKNAKHGPTHIEYDDHHSYHNVDHHDHFGGEYDDEHYYDGPGHLKKYDGAYDSVQKPYEGAFPTWL